MDKEECLKEAKRLLRNIKDNIMFIECHIYHLKKHNKGFSTTTVEEVLGTMISNVYGLDVLTFNSTW